MSMASTVISSVNAAHADADALTSLYDTELGDTGVQEADEEDSCGT